MVVILYILLAIPILVYLPGAAILRASTDETASARAWTRLAPLPEIIGSVCLTSWVGLMLADAGCFSLGRLGVGLLGLAAPCAVRIAVRRGRVPANGDMKVLGAGVVIALLAACLYLPGFDTSIMGSDASFYRATGVHLARRGALSIDDPMLAELRPGEPEMLFSPNVYGGWARVPGGFTLTTPGAKTVYPSFSHLLPVWIAIAHSLGGPAAIDLVGPFFGWIALWTIWLVARELWGGFAAGLAVALVGVNLAEWFYVRFLMPEILAQTLLWGGLLAFIVWWREGGRAAALLAGLALGATTLARVEDLFLVPCAVALFLGWTTRRPRGVAMFATAFGVVVAYGIGHFLLVPTHYRDAVRIHALLARETLVGAVATVGNAGIVLAVVASAGAVVLARRRRVPPERVLATFTALAGVAVYATRSPIMLGTTSVWLAETTSWVVLVAAVVGFGLLLARSDARGLPLVVLVVVGLPFLWNPHVTPTQLWGIRRFVPVLVPWVGLLAASVPARLLHGHRALALSLAAVLLVTNAYPVWRLRGLRFFPPQTEALANLAAQLPNDAVVFVAPELTAHLVHLPLWITYDREPLVLSPIRWQETVGIVAPRLAARHPVVLLANRFGPPPAFAGVEAHTRADVDLHTVTPELGPLRAPARATAHLVPLRVYELTRLP